MQVGQLSAQWKTNALPLFVVPVRCIRLGTNVCAQVQAFRGLTCYIVNIKLFAIIIRQKNKIKKNICKIYRQGIIIIKKKMVIIM